MEINQKLTVKETKELIAFGLTLVSAAYVAKTNDGKIDQADLPLLIPPLMDFPAAIDGISLVPAELADLDENEALEIKELILAKLPAVSEKWKSVAGHALMVAQGAVGLWDDFKPVPVV